MHLLFGLTACLSFASHGTFAAAALSPTLSTPLTPRAVDVQAAATSLQPLLSEGAEVVFPNETDWAPLQVRGSSPRIQPNYSVVVEVATEEDIQQTVQIAHSNGIPFLAVSGTHGWTKTLNNLPFGFQINMRKLNSSTVNADGNTATLGGGALQYEVTRSLFAQNKQAGPGMGGGHSLLQNQYGYVSDNIVSARVITANGTLVTASATSHPDLFWAIRGAGHNFVVVASLVVNVFDFKSNWTVTTLIYSQDKIEQLFPLINEVEDSATRPTTLAYTGVITRVPDIDPDNAVIIYNLDFEGSEAEAAQYTTPFQDIGPIATTVATDVDYVQLYTVTQNNLDSTACRRNLNVMGSGASLPEWNATAARAAYTVFNEMTADSRYNTSVLLLENYGMKGVQAVNANASSLSLEERKYPIVANPTIWWEGNKTQDTTDAYAYGEAIRAAWFSGTTAAKHTYVNYAIGTESFEQMYGYDSWRVDKLKALKRTYDPDNKFGYYNPVPAS